VNINRLKRLEAKYKKARQEWCNAIEEELPIGTILKATLSNACIRGEVIGYGRDYYGGSVLVQNTHTGKTRRVCPTFSDHEVRVVAEEED
jgi:hypothetical protein